MNTIETLQVECTRVREIIARCESTPTAASVATWLRALVSRSEKAIADQDAVACVACLKELREVKE